MKQLKYLLIPLYLFLTSLGIWNISPFENAPQLRLTTLAALAFLVVQGKRTLQLIWSSKICQAALLLQAFSLLTCLLSPYPSEVIAQGVRNHVYFLYYFLLGCAVYSLPLSKKYHGWVFVSLLLAASVVAGTSIIDFHFWDIPSVPSRIIFTHVGGFSFLQSHAAFSERTAFALFAGAFFVSTALAPLEEKGRIIRVLQFFVTTSLFYAVLLSHNRSTPLAIVLVLALGLLMKRSVKTGIAAIIVSILLHILFNPATVVSYLYNFSLVDNQTTWLNTYLESQKLFGVGLHVNAEQLLSRGVDTELVQKSDALRLTYLKAVLIEISHWPFGRGLSKVPVEGMGFRDPHSAVGSLLHAFAIPGVFFLFYLLSMWWKKVSQVVQSKVLNRSDQQCLVVYLGIFSVWLLIGLMHNVLYAGIAWISGGLILQILYHKNSFEA